ncbi:hypothetical protein PAT3040_00567 [Paenibacillus agaridevorans]|uniref:Uncharacterized protein n=1 Tax=Paenibacillus agaridevorans TaxID=171404 RepID=A0A2R5ERR5_9BACL|nr:hypothetical protein PAT3040_00567 [Paenibacillus agaridevorans]
MLTRLRILNAAEPKQMLTKYVSFGNIAGAHVALLRSAPQFLAAFNLLGTENRTF